MELIARDRASADDVARHVEAAEAHLATLLGTFDALLRLGEIEAGQARAGFRPLDLSAVVAEMADSYAPLFEERDKTLTASVPPGQQAEGDPALLQQLLANLLENALDHSRDGARVTVRLDAAPGRLDLVVHDDGPGIPAPLRATIFDRFVRADASRTSGGSGLGLSLVKAIAELHGGTATVEDAAPGAAFRVTLPTG